MKKAKAARVPILEKAFEVNLPRLMRMAKAGGESRLVLDDGDVRTVAMLAETRLAVFLGGRAWAADIVAVQCLQGRARPLLKCPRAHEGNFQSLYFWGNELACRKCLNLRYRTTLAPSPADRRRLAHGKALAKMGGSPGEPPPCRPLGAWRRRYVATLNKLEVSTAAHYGEIRRWLKS